MNDYVGDRREMNQESPDFVITIKDGKFAWNSSESTLDNINAKFEPGKLYAIVGPVGSGKSSLLNAIAGQMQCKSGNVLVHVSK